MKTYQFIWQLIRYRSWRFFVGLTGRIAHSLARLVFGLFLQAFFNSLSTLQHGPTRVSAWPWLLIGVLVVAALLRFVVQAATLAPILNCIFSTTALLQRNLLRHVLQRPGARAIPGSAGEAINYFRDDTTVLDLLFAEIANMVGLLMFVVPAWIILWRVDALMTLLVFLPLLCVVAIAQTMRQRLGKLRAASRIATGQLTGAIGEIFGAVQAIQVAGAEPFALKYFRRISEQRRKQILRDTVFYSALQSIFGNTVGVGTGMILMLAALSRHLHAGDIVIFISYLGTITNFIVSIASLLSQYAQSKVSHQRLVELLQGAPEKTLLMPDTLYLNETLPEMTVPIKTTADSLKVLTVKNLSYRYPDTGRGIEDISFQLQRGTLTVITGRIASGKTTLLQNVLGLLPKEHGEICWNERMVADPASFFVPPRSAYTPQVPHLFSDPLVENILLGLPAESVDLTQALQMAVMERDVANLEHGLQTIIGTRGVKLSGGQVQRTAAARMLVRNSELLVFDDLSSALDVETEQLLWERIFSQGTSTCLVVSHRKAVLQRADHIIVLKGGKVEAAGTLEIVLDSCEEMRRLWQGEWDSSGQEASNV